MKTVARPHTITISLTFYGINVRTLALSFMKYVPEGISIQNKPVSSILKSCFVLLHLFSMTYMKISRNISAAFLLAAAVTALLFSVFNSVSSINSRRECTTALCFGIRNPKFYHFIHPLGNWYLILRRQGDETQSRTLRNLKSKHEDRPRVQTEDLLIVLSYT